MKQTAPNSLPRRSLHQPLFPIWAPPPPSPDASSFIIQPPPPSATSPAISASSPSSSATVNIIAIATSAGLVAVAIVIYSCFLFWRRRNTDGNTISPKRNLDAAARTATTRSDAGSSSMRRLQSPPPSSIASGPLHSGKLDQLIGINAVNPTVEEFQQASPELRPLQRLARPEPPPVPPLVVESTSSVDEQETYYTALRTVASTYSRSPSQRSNVELNKRRPPRPPPPPPPPPLPRRRRLLRKLPTYSSSRDVLRDDELPSRAEDDAEEYSGGDDDEVMVESLRPPSLKPLHWDKLKAISEKGTVWDQLKKSDSFRVDEVKMESLFVNNNNATTSSKGVENKQQIENRVLDQRRLQNIAILLKALNTTSEEVTQALLDGNHEYLGAEFLETLSKMAPTTEEELKLRHFTGDLAKLDPAECFLKDVIDIPFAFKRVDAMLFMATFDSEIHYIRNSLETLEAACEALRSSKLFLKLLEAVLKTGNRLNVGTNRGEAKAFKLDTLLQLADIKATDGKTSLLHFVVQEIIRSEGLSLSGGSNQTEQIPPNKAANEQFRKQGLKVLAGLSSELANVKVAATIETEVLTSYIMKLETGLDKVRLVLVLENTREDGSSTKFFKTMEVFLKEAQEEIERVKVADKKALELVKATTEYFHGDVSKEEAHPLRIFVVVRDFLSILDRVCKDADRMPERVMMGSGRSLHVAPSSSLKNHKYEIQRETDSDEDSSSS